MKPSYERPVQGVGSVIITIIHLLAHLLEITLDEAEIFATAGGSQVERWCFSLRRSFADLLVMGLFPFISYAFPFP